MNMGLCLTQFTRRRHQQGIVEAAACWASIIIKGTAYNDGPHKTMLTKLECHAQHKSISIIIDQVACFNLFWRTFLWKEKFAGMTILPSISFILL